MSGAGAAGTTTLGAKVAAGIAAGAIVVTAATGTVVSYDAIRGLGWGLKVNALYHQMLEAQRGGVSSATSTGTAEAPESAEANDVAPRDATLTGKLIGEDELPQFDITINIHANGTVDGTVGGSYTPPLEGEIVLGRRWDQGRFAGTVDSTGAMKVEGALQSYPLMNGAPHPDEDNRYPMYCAFEMSGELSEEYSFVGEARVEAVRDNNGNPVDALEDYYAISATEK